MPFRDLIKPFFRSRTMAFIGALAMLCGLYSLIPAYVEFFAADTFSPIPSQIHAALSLVLGCLLVFRTNSAYSRWWEARTLWGTLVNASRNLGIKLSCLVDLTQEDRSLLKRHLTRFPVVLTEHLRRVPSNVLSTRADGGSSEWDHRPAEEVHHVYRWIAKAKSNGQIDGDELRVIDTELAKLLEVCGGCERIARTPIVRSYRTFARQCTILFLLTLPWGIVHEFGWWTIPLTIIISYFMLGLEIVAEHVEDPFGHDEDDLDLEGLCKTIERSLAEILST
jgi:ion channel-forming bestrophin family protein